MDAGGKIEPSAGRGVAIVGMACTFPGAPNLETFWQNIVGKVDAVDDVPPERWDPEIFHDPQPGQPGRIYCKRGGYLPASIPFDPVEFGIMPSAVPGTEPDQFIVLKTARDALTDANYVDELPEGDRTELIMGRGNYLGPGFVNLIQRGPIVEQTLHILRQLHPEYGMEELGEIAKELRGQLPSFGPETAAGMIPNLTTGRVANRLGFTGPNFTIDAACASSLIATDIGVRDLLNGQCDVALVGGVHVFNNVPFLMVFCALHAMSLSSNIRPFDQRADGTMPGEGVGVLVLKRVEDAEKDKDRIYAVIRGVGTSSDGRAGSVTAPSVAGEELALRRAYDSAGISPETIRLVEAHGTATVVGDASEIQALTNVFGRSQEGTPVCALGSVKSMIGHAMPAAGMAAIIKSALSIYHGVLPPTLNCEQPLPQLEGNEAFFYMNTDTRPWVHGFQKFPRRAGVDAFGFGGTNAHVVLEEHSVDKPTEQVSLLRQWETEAFLIGGGSRQELLANAKQVLTAITKAPDICLKDLAYTLNTDIADCEQRLAIVASSSEDLRGKLERAIDRIEKPDCKQIKDVRGIYFFEEKLSQQGKLAFLLAGEGAQYVNMLSDLCIHFPEVRECFDNADRTAESIGVTLPSQDLFPPPTRTKEAEKRLWDIERATEAVLTADGALFTMLEKLGIKPDVMVGHSAGEWAAMAASGILDLQQFLSSFDKLHDVHVKLSERGDIPKATMLAVGSARETVEPIFEQAKGTTYIANDNCPHQVVVVGDDAALESGIVELKKQGIPFEKLPFDRGYHTPLFDCICEPLREYFSQLDFSSPKTPVYSCTTAELCPDDANELLELAVHTFARPLEFRKTIEKMYADGVRLFVEVGPKGNLTAFVDDILRKKPHLAIASDVSRRPGTTQLNHLVAMLAAQGVAMTLDHLYSRRAPQKLSLESVIKGKDQTAKRTTVELKLTFPVMSVAKREHKPVQQQVVPESVARTEAVSDVGVQEEPEVVHSEPDGIMQQHLRTMQRFLEIQQDTMQTYLSGEGSEELLPEGAVDAVLQPAMLSDEREYESAIDNSSPSEVEQPVQQPQPEVEPTTATDVDLATIETTMLDLVSEKTGYPKDMLDLDADMEADLGIDSIKRIEILGSFQQEFAEQFPVDQQEMDVEEIASQRTMRQLMAYLNDHLSGNSDTDVSSKVASATQEAAISGSDTGKGVRNFPLVGELIRSEADKEMTFLRKVDVEEDLYLEDHSFGRYISAYDASLRPLPVVPMTVALETMAEAAAVLAPDMRVVTILDARSMQWIQVPEGEESVYLQIAARRLPVDPNRIHVQIKRSEADGSLKPDAPVIAQMTAVLAPEFPEAPNSEKLLLAEERSPKVNAKQLYSDHWMFHGPRFQGVAGMSRIGQDGVDSELEALPRNKLFNSISDPDLLIDPCLLDAGGQMVGYWPLEYLETGRVVFPVGIQQLHLFGPPPAVGERVACQVRIQDTSPQLLKADIDFVDSAGKVCMRVIGWQDWRFFWPPEVYKFWKFPERTVPSMSLNLFGGESANEIDCRVAKSWGSMSAGMWQNSWACLLLGQEERRTFQSLKSEKRRAEWLLGRTAAKDAVRALVKKQKGIELYPADVCINSQEGKPVVSGKWVDECGQDISLSLSHKDDVAVAVAGISGNVGVDVERLRELKPSFESAAFSEKEKSLVDNLGATERNEWLLRFWCAKEAVGKAFGVGLKGGPQGQTVTRVDAVGGRIWVTLGEKLSAMFGSFAHESVLVYTQRQEDFVFAVTRIEKV